MTISGNIAYIPNVAVAVHYTLLAGLQKSNEQTKSSTADEPSTLEPDLP